MSMNGVTPEWQVPVTLSSVGGETYSYIHNLDDPKPVKDHTFSELCEVMKGHFQPRVSVFRKRIQFYDLKQKQSETISQWFAQVKTFSVECKFDNNLDFAVKDKFVHGLYDKAIQDCLCEENTSRSLTDLYEIAMRKESTLSVPEAELVCKSNTNTLKEDKRLCRACGNPSHDFSKCRFRTHICLRCKQKGHVASVCPKGVNCLEDSEDLEQVQGIQGELKNKEVDIKAEIFSLDKQDSNIFPSCSGIKAEAVDLKTEELYLNDEDLDLSQPQSGVTYHLTPEPIWINSGDESSGEDRNIESTKDPIAPEEVWIKGEAENKERKNDASTIESPPNTYFSNMTSTLPPVSVNNKNISSKIETADSYQLFDFNMDYSGEANKLCMPKDINENPLTSSFSENRTVDNTNRKRRRTGKTDKNKEKPHSCSYCDYRALKTSHLKNHIMNKHTKEKPLSCTHCDYRTVETSHLKRHIMMKHTNERPFPCPYCEYRTVEASHLKNHIMVKHTKEKPFSCSYCKYRAVKSSNLKRHIMTMHTTEKPLSCSYCDYRTVQFSNLKKHIMVKHAKEKPFACPDCEYKTSEASHLKIHILAKHTNERPLSCTYCDYRAVQLSNLKKHIMVKHTNEKSLSCTNCDYKTVSPSDLKKHIMAKHTSERPLACSFCDYRTVESSSLKRHIAARHS